MSKPDDIPQDVWDAAVHGTHDSWDNPPLVLARVIVAERERCHGILRQIAEKLTDRANAAFDGRDQGSAIILKSQADALLDAADAIKANTL